MHPRYLQNSQEVMHRTPSHHALHPRDPTSGLPHETADTVLTVQALEEHDGRPMRPGNQRRNVELTSERDQRFVGLSRGLRGQAA